MEKILKKELSLGKATLVGVTFVFAFFFALSIFFCARMYSRTEDIVMEQAAENMANISQLNESSIARAIGHREAFLRMISAQFTERGVDTVNEILKELGAYREFYEFYSMGVITQEHKLYLTNGRVADISGTTFDGLAWDGGFHLSESYKPYAGGKRLTNAFTYPVYFDGEIKYVLLATTYSKDLAELMNISSMGGKVFNFVVNKEGEVMVYPEFYENTEYSDLMDYINRSADILPSQSGDGHFEYQDERYYAHFEKLEYNDWYLVTCARESDVFVNARMIMNIVIVAVVVLWIIILASSVCLLLSIRRSRRELRHKLYYDELLGIGNEAAMNVYFKNTPIEELEGKHLVVFDVDKFKEYNYIYGEDEGDRLLKYIATVFREEVPGTPLFRYKSDHFISIDERTDRAVLDTQMTKVLERYARDVEAHTVHPFDTSAGVRRIERGVPLRRLVSDAIIAKETIKGNHLLHHSYYDERLRLRRMSYMEMESELSAALKAGEFKVYYQPKYDMASGKVTGAEALARWIRPDGTIISPGEFIPCFEASRQIVQLDEAMLEAVCRQMQEMQEEGIRVKPVSVNLSRVHLQQPGMLKRIETIIGRYRIDPAWLSFEITERALLEESIPMKAVLDFLHSLGCHVEMDDYGVGASGPNALATNSFDVVKLDKSYIDGIGNRRMEDVIGSTIFLAKRWNMEIIAEGVEEKYQADRLIKMGCTKAQGYYYSRPIPEETYKNLLANE